MKELKMTKLKVSEICDCRRNAWENGEIPDRKLRQKGLSMRKLNRGSGSAIPEIAFQPKFMPFWGHLPDP